MKRDLLKHTFCIGIALLVSYWLGEVLALFVPMPHAGEKMLLIVGTGWMLQLLTAFLFMKQGFSAYFRNITLLMLIGVLCLVPGNALCFFFDWPTVLVPALSVLLSSAVMLYRHVLLIRALKKSQLWTLSWFLLLQSTAIFWVYYFYSTTVL